jgi:hypothetical protein
MSARLPTAAEKRTLPDVSNVPIVLQKSFAPPFKKFSGL